MFVTHLSICTLFIVILPKTLYGTLVPPTPIVGIELTEAGLHRDLLYTVQFDYPLAGKECEYILEQPLPAAVYVSVDQLDDLKRLNKLNAIYPHFVDIEVPTEKAKPFTVLLKGTPKITESFRLPIHFRYHAPSSEHAYVTVHIPTPTMYMKCPNNERDLFANNVATVPSVKYCLQHHSCSFSSYAADDDKALTGADAEHCDWILVQLDCQLKSSLRAEIPIGNERAFPPVLYATIIVSWIISLWTVFRTHTIPRRINHKLEEQRILQSKIK